MRLFCIIFFWKILVLTKNVISLTETSILMLRERTKRRICERGCGWACICICVFMCGGELVVRVCVCALEKERDGEELGGVNRKVHWMIDVSWDQKMVEKSNRFSFFFSGHVATDITRWFHCLITSTTSKGNLSPCPYKLCFDCRDVRLQPIWHCSIDFTIICCKMERIDPGSNPACSWALGHLLSSQSNWKFVTASDKPAVTKSLKPKYWFYCILNAASMILNEFEV